MQLEIDLNSSDNIVSLDRIIDMVLENAEEEKYQLQFEYMKLYEQKFMEGVKRYSHDIRRPEFDNLSERQMEEMVEKQSSDLHEIAADACIAYLRHGMKLGACIILGLLH